MSLQNLLALQAKQKAKTHGNTAQAASVDVPLGESDATSPPASTSADEDSAESVAPDAASAPEASTQGEPVKPRAVGLNLLGGLGKRPVQSNPRPVAEPESSGDSDSSGPGEDDSAVFGLADLAAFDASEAPLIQGETTASSSSWFDDEIEATAPERALDPDMTVQQQEFVEQLDGIYQVLNDPEMFGQAVRIIMMELQEHKEYAKLVQDQDVHVMIRAMRNTMGLARIKKQEKSRSKGGAAAKTSRVKKSSVSEGDLSILDSIMGGLNV